ncbi:hypothetical protein pb186bvf_001071 [Paramecium bursaria]
MKAFLGMILLSLFIVGEAQFIQLSNGAQLHTFEGLKSLDFINMDCETNFLELQKSLDFWHDLVVHQGQIQKDINLLEKARVSIQSKNTYNEYEKEVKKQATKILAQFGKAHLPSWDNIYNNWREEETKEMQQSLNLLHTAVTEEDSKQCCDKIEKLINKYLEDRKNISSQCGNQKITINIIDGNQDQVEIVKHKCKGQTGDDDGIKINHITSEEFLKQQPVASKPTVISEPPKVISEPPRVISEPPRVIADPPRPIAPPPPPKVEEVKAEELPSRPPPIPVPVAAEDPKPVAVGLPAPPPPPPKAVPVPDSQVVGLPAPPPPPPKLEKAEPIVDVNQSKQVESTVTKTEGTKSSSSSSSSSQTVTTRQVSEKVTRPPEVDEEGDFEEQVFTSEVITKTVTKLEQIDQIRPRQYKSFLEREYDTLIVHNRH